MDDERATSAEFLAFEKITLMFSHRDLHMNVLRMLACVLLMVTPLLQGCNAFGVHGTALRAPAGHVENVVVDISAAGGLMGPFWKNDLEPAITDHTPAAFAKYGVKARTDTLANEESTRPASERRETYIVRISAKDRWSGSSGTIYGLNVVLLSPQGVQLWAGTAGFAWNPVRDYDKSAQAFVENIAEQLNNSGMFSGTATVAASGPSKSGLSAGALAALEIYKSAPTPKAFVVEDGGHWVSVNDHGGKNATSPADRALAACAQAGFTGCRVVAVDNTVYN